VPGMPASYVPSREPGDDRDLPRALLDRGLFAHAERLAFAQSLVERARGLALEARGRAPEVAARYEKLLADPPRGAFGSDADELALGTRLANRGLVEAAVAVLDGARAAGRLGASDEGKRARAFEADLLVDLASFPELAATSQETRAQAFAHACKLIAGVAGVDPVPELEAYAYRARALAASDRRAEAFACARACVGQANDAANEARKGLALDEPVLDAD